MWRMCISVGGRRRLFDWARFAFYTQHDIASDFHLPDLEATREKMYRAQGPDFKFVFIHAPWV